MDIRKLTSTAVPYLVFAAIFSVLAWASGYGFVERSESLALAACDQLAKSGDFYAQHWGSAALYAPLLQPVYSLLVTLNGGVDGIVYLMRIVFLAVDFAVALVAYRVLQPRLGREVALTLSAVYLFFAGTRTAECGPCNLGLTLAFVSMLFGYKTAEQAQQDDGTTTGYARILCPVLAGLIAMLSLAFAPEVIIVVAGTLAVSICCVAKSGRRDAVYLYLWVGAGALLGIVCYLLVVLGYGEPDQLFSAFTSGAQSDLYADGYWFQSRSIIASLFILVLVCFVAKSLNDNTFTQVNEPSAIWSYITPAVFALLLVLVALQPFITNGQSKLSGGPASGLSVASDDASVYEHAVELAKKVTDSKSVCVINNATAGETNVGRHGARSTQTTQWAYLLLPGMRSDDGAEWVLVFSGKLAIEPFPDGLSSSYGEIASSGQWHLYKRAGKIGAIAQG